MIHAQAIDPSLAGVLTAIVGGIVGIGGLFLNVVGKRDQTRQQIAADAAASDRTELDRTYQALDAVQRRAELAESGERLLREESSRLRREINELEEAVDRQRDAHREDLRVQDARFREERAAFTEQLVSLRGIVNDQIARAAGATFLDMPLPHPDDDPPVTPGDVER